MHTSDFKVVLLGQTVLQYQVPLDIFNTINQIYETKYGSLPAANKQLIGKIKKEHSLFYQGKDTSKMHHHNMLPDNVLQWIDKAMGQYLDFNNTTNGYYPNAVSYTHLTLPTTPYV